VLNYCSPVWGIENVDKPEIFQNNYLRRLFNLPRKSPNWFCRLEFDCYSIECDYMKNPLHFWKRLFLRPRNSLIYVCYKQLQIHADNMNMKHNWYRSLRSLLMKWNCHKILEIESSRDDPSYLCIRPRINRLVSSIRLQPQQLDIIRMQASISMPLYQIIKTHCKSETYLNANLGWSDTKILAQHRSNTGKLGQVNLTGLQYMYRVFHVDPPHFRCIYLKNHIGLKQSNYIFEIHLTPDKALGGPQRISAHFCTCQVGLTEASHYRISKI
jgi:hypothetical protein